MSCCAPKTEEALRDKEIRRLLENYQKDDSREIKLLLLGAGSSGKSTIFKQIRIIHDQGFTPVEINQYRDVVHENVFACLIELNKGMDSLEINYESEQNKNEMERIVSLPRNELKLTPEMGPIIDSIWKDAGIRRCYDNRSRFQLYDSCAYYLDDILRLSADDYRPTEQDVIRARLKTVGIVERRFSIQEFNFRLVDVGGQRNERRKWIHAFDNVTAVLFVVAISEYDQVLVEDNNMNRMRESELLFNDICNNRWFRNRAVIIFFNKNDLFEEKIKRVDLNVCYPEYTGGLGNYDAALRFIMDKFRKFNSNPERTVYTHVTTATNTENIKVVFHASKSIIIEEMLKDHAIL